MVDPLVERSPRLVWSVAALLHAVSDALAARFPVCTVQGEIAGLSQASSGHSYFNLKDADGAAALVRCAMFRRAASLLDFTPADGQRVEVRARLAVYEARGELQLVVESMQRAGAGALFEQFLRLKARLESEGLFDASRKREPAAYPRRIGVVTSLGAAALHDVLTTLARRSPQVEVIVYPSLVQGSEAPGALCAALALAAARAEVDTLLLVRGGGSFENLWAFNDERVVRAVAASPIPIVCGVGHETDITLADLAADLRAPTPTAAAELAAPSREACAEMLDVLARVLQRRVHEVLDTKAQRLDHTRARMVRPLEHVQRRAAALALLGHRLRGALGHAVDLRGVSLHVLPDRLARAAAVLVARCHAALDAIRARLEALDPQHVLARGYAWLTDAKGKPVLSVPQVRPGDHVRATLADGQVDLLVEAVSPSRDAGT